MARYAAPRSPVNLTALPCPASVFIINVPPVVMEAGNGLLGHDLSSYTSDASLTPPSGSRSVTASPPRGILSPEVRELKRQQDQARRDSKARMRRAGSGSSFGQSPPVTMADLAAATSTALPVYTTGPTQISLQAEPTTAATLAPSPYLPSYSPPLTDQGQAMFPGHYQQPYLQDYGSGYPSSTGPGLPPQYG